ncbi:MAG: ABC transporter permease, partial [Planctomycetes bacterium]|nr:ABC transporter permease [Planctomycetota bacterium]
VIGLTSWTGVARLIRGEMLRQKKMEYVSASIALGASDTRTIFRQILPNAMAPVLVSISFGITGAILTEASLSFIGFGVTPPTPTWGQLLSETRESPLANWWLAVFPGVVLFVSVLAYNMVGEALRDALDPRTTL